MGEKLTKAQRKFIADAARGTNGIPPDVLIGGEVTMAQKLCARGLIQLLNAHPVTGRMHQAFYATPAGRAALQSKDKQHD